MIVFANLGREKSPSHCLVQAIFCAFLLLCSGASAFSAAPASPPYPITPGYNATNVAVNKIFAWWRVSGATSYRIQVSTTTSFQTTVVNQSGITDSTFTVTGLNPTTTYYWRTKAVNADGESDWAYYWQFSTANGVNPFPQPTLITPSNQTALTNPASLSWNSVGGASWYAVEVSQSSGFWSTAFSGTTASTSISVSGLSVGSTYYWRVNGMNQYGNSGWSAVRSFTVNLNTPYPVTPLYNATNVPVNKTFAWWRVSGTSSYKLQISTSSNFQTTVVNQTYITDSTFTVNGLASGTTYYWRLKAATYNMESDWMNPWQFTTAENSAPAMPTLSSPSNSAVNIALSPSFSWNSSNTASAYTIQVSANANFGTFVVNATTAQTSFSGSGLNANATYYWRVNAFNQYGTSAWSETRSFSTITTANILPPNAPTLASPANSATSQSTSLSLSWNAASGANSYTVQVSQSSNFATFTANSSTGTTNYSLSGLPFNTTYYWRVNVGNQAGTSSWSETRSFTTMAQNNGGNGGGNIVHFYVNDDAPAGGNGTQANPFQTISSALNAANGSVQYIIHVAGGLYTENIGSSNDMYGNSREYVFLGGYDNAFVNRNQKSEIVALVKNKPVFEFYNTAAVTIDGFDISGGKSGVQITGWSSGRSATLLHNRIHHNGYWTNHQNYDSVMSGGGACVIATTVAVEGNTIDENIGYNFGGGLNVSGVGAASVATIKKNLIKKNLNVGGACHGAGILLSTNGLIEKNTVDQNTFNTSYGGTQSGVAGGILVMGSGINVTVNANLITRNTGHSGGGLMLDEGATALITNNVIAKNYSYQRGGGIRIDGAGTNLFSYAKILNNTIVYNTAGADPDGTGGHGLHVSDGQVSGANNLFWGNGLGNNDVYLSGSNATITLSYCLLNDFAITNSALDSGNPPTFGNGILLAGTDVINPKFIDTTAENWRLLSNSPLINAGTSSFGTPNLVPDKDFDGGARPFGNSADIGADEYGSGANYAHPRIWMTPEIRQQLLAKVQANDPDWVALKAQADMYKNYSVTQYKFATASNWFAGTIQYGYQGGEWYEAAIPLTFAYQLTGDTAYSHKAIQLADEMVRAMADPDNNWGYKSPFNMANTYPSRYVGPAAALIYDYCYDKLSATQKQQLINIFNVWYDSTRKAGGLAYENNNHSHGNHFGGHMLGIGLLGLATFGDNPRAQAMMDWARYRVDGTPSALLEASDIPTDYRKQNFDGDIANWVGYIPGISPNFDGGRVRTFAGGHNPQGWSYANSDFGNNQIDLCIAFKTALDVDMIAPNIHWYKNMFNALKHSMLPARFMIDPIGDWGGNYGIGFQTNLPHRLAYLLEGTDVGAQAQYFVTNWLPQNYEWSSYANGLKIPGHRPWEGLLFRKANRTSAPFAANSPTSFNVVPEIMPNGTSQNRVIPYYIMRSSWDTTAVWASAQMGAGHCTDHQHFHAGHIHVVRGKDQMLISPSNYKMGDDSLGVTGVGLEYTDYSGAKNTLFFNDWEVYRPKASGRTGGQDGYGFDRPITNELTNDYTYLRSDLASAYNYVGWHNGQQKMVSLADTVDRPLEKFYRNFVYLPGTSVFVVYDQVKVKASNHANGAYERHLRWHFGKEPIISGNSLRLDKGNSRLWLTTLSPSVPKYTKYNMYENNPDNWQQDPNLDYMFKSKHWRVEMRDTTYPLSQTYLTAMQVGASNLAQPAMTQILSNSGNMRGVHVAVSGGVENVVLFNTADTTAPQYIVSTQYPMVGSSSATHILCGMKVNGTYSASLQNGIISVAENQNGTLTASAGGVLKFSPFTLGLAKTGIEETVYHAGIEGVSCYPNPANERLVINFTVLKDMQFNVDVRDLFGRTVLTKEPVFSSAGVQAIELNTAGLADGIYIARIYADGRTTDMKFVIAR